MENVFLKVVNLSITASWLVLAVVVLRLVLKKAPICMNISKTWFPNLSVTVASPLAPATPFRIMCQPKASWP